MKSFTVLTAAPAVFPVPRTIAGSITVAAIPGSGGTLKVESQTAPDGAWFVWDQGTDGVVSVATQAKLDSKVHALKFTAATAAGSVELGF
jgi:hypothetical protein